MVGYDSNALVVFESEDDLTLIMGRLPYLW